MRINRSDIVKTFTMIISLTGLGLTLFPSILVFLGKIGFQLYLNLMLLGSIVWFGAAPFWMNKRHSSGSKDEYRF